MADMSLKQITDKLNSEFAGEERRLIFWYDEGGSFAEDVDGLDLENAKVYHLEPDNQFYTKYFFECVDTTGNYLVYAPFAKPDVRYNHLEDTVYYSGQFYADRASLLTLDLGIDERYKPVIQRYIKFFQNKTNSKGFYDLELDVYNQKTIEIGLMSVLCKCKTASFEEVMRKILISGGFDDNSYSESFEKYGLSEAFWRQVSDNFGYADENPTLEKLTMCMFVTYFDRAVETEIPSAWRSFLSFKSGNITVFLDNLMNSSLYGEDFDLLSEQIYYSLKGEEELSKLPLEALVSCGIFAGIDSLLIKWAAERLELEDIGAKLGEVNIPQLVKIRSRQHFGKQRKAEYFAIENAWHIIVASCAKYLPYDRIEKMAEAYTGSLCLTDRWYRYFYYYLDKLEDCEGFDKLKQLIENIYANEFLAKVCTNWSQLLAEQGDSLEIEKQVDFYARNVEFAKDQTVVIISDALRYEVGLELFERLQEDEKCTAEISAAAGVLPSVTEYGMAALLPHRNIELDGDYSVTVDGQKTDKTEQREAVLQKYKKASRCVQYDDIKGMNTAELRQIFTRQDVVYIYHNQIDARGDKRSTENEVFNACEEAVEEIIALIRRLNVSANRSHFIVTADHGFLYRRNKLKEGDKIPNAAGEGVCARRYMLTENEISEKSVVSFELGQMMKNGDRRVVSCPVGADVFKANDPGLNYVHGGCSPQEMLIPLIKVKTQRSRRETTTAKITLISLSNKITNLITSLDFLQSEAVSDVVKEATYRVYFVAENGDVISNESLYKADNREKESPKRIFKLRFSFKNKKYDKTQKYYLVAYDEKTNLEVLRREFTVDIAFADDFGFGL
ncbi:MAG: BREX-1 system phosphatase PglZ type A [Eubacterium sp.]|nr:BREX-1 system phosphatase PglZ type A [Eubacterium sp.]